MNTPQRHGDTEEMYELTRHIIQCAIAVHRTLGPGLLENAYETALCIELDDEGLRYERQKRVAGALQRTVAWRICYRCGR